MFRKNGHHQQTSMFSSISSLPQKLQNRLEESWAGTFYRQWFARIDEELFSVLYSDEPSRPNIPINVLVGLETLKSGFGWSDEEMYDHFCFDMQVRYALGYRDLREGHFELRTMYNFRRRLSQQMQASGENLIEKAFEQVTDEQIAAFQLKTNKLRMDSTLIASNIREMSRLQLLVEVLQRAHRILKEAEQEQYADDFAPYLKGSSGQYIYHIKGEKSGEHLRRIGELMRKLLAELPASYVDESSYQLLQRVFREHFVVEEAELRVKEGQELSASSLQSPDDQEATYRQKRGEGHTGYAANLTETCDPENPLQLIVETQTASNNRDDAAMLAEALADLKERTDVEQIYTDGGYNSPEVDAAMRGCQVEQIQTAIRGRKRAPGKLGLDDFGWGTNADAQPQTVTCPHGQQVAVQAGRNPLRYQAGFDAASCESCPFSEQCPARRLKHKPERRLRFSQKDLDLALRRKRSAEARASGRNLRAAVEATVRAIKHQFGNGKLPVRGLLRMSMMVTESAAMTNVRRIHCYQMAQRAGGADKAVYKGTARAPQQSAVSFCASLWGQLWHGLRSLSHLRPALAYQS